VIFKGDKIEQKFDKGIEADSHELDAEVQAK
jgi:hypothetical protein